MLIILKQDDSCQVAQTTCTTNSLEIRYKDYSVLKKTLDLNTKSINSDSCTASKLKQVKTPMNGG